MVSIRAIVARKIELIAWQQWMFPDLMAPSLMIYLPAFSRKIGAELA